MSWVLSVEVTSAQGKSELFSIEADQARIGSAAHCEIRLPPDEAAAEHVTLHYRDDTLYARALASTPPALLDGGPFQEQALRAGSVLRIGSTSLRVSVQQGAEGVRRARSQRKSSPLLYIALPVLVAYAIIQLPRASSSPESAPQRAPELFGAWETCPEQHAVSARAFGRERLDVAEWKRERSPFHAADGVAAVKLYHLAAECFEAASDTAVASYARQAAQRLQQDLEEKYRTHRVRLEHALSIRDHLVARREVRSLLDLTGDMNDEYVTWLRSLERRIKLRGESKK